MIPGLDTVIHTIVSLDTELVALRNAALAYVHTRIGGDQTWSVPNDPEKEAHCAYWLKVFEEKVGRELGGKIVLRKFPINQIHSEWRLAFEENQ